MTDLEKEQMIEENRRRIEQLEQLQESAMQLWQIYQSFLSVGFTKKQSFAIIKEVLIRGLEH